MQQSSYSCQFFCQKTENNPHINCLSNYFLAPVQQELKKLVLGKWQDQKTAVRNLCQDPREVYMRKAVQFCKSMNCGPPFTEGVVVIKNF